jgi:hypothetical protein
VFVLLVEEGFDQGVGQLDLLQLFAGGFAVGDFLELETALAVF